MSTKSHEVFATWAAPRTALALVLALAAAACAADAAPDDDDLCADGTCDVPDDPAVEMCELRRADAFNANRLAYTPDSLRWSCADSEGVTDEDRGQEYCEYFAIVDVPADRDEIDGEGSGAVVVGRNLGVDSSEGTTPTDVELTPAQIGALEKDASAVAGQCVFTSWNSDITTPLPACADGACPTVAGVTVDPENFRMKFDVNSADAGAVLVDECMTYELRGNSPATPAQLADDFFRGCMLNDQINETSFRKSDSTVCAASMRLRECGCELGLDAADFADALSPTDRRGFPLGTWSGFVLGDEAKTRLPPDCRYVTLGDDSQTVVTCDFTAADLLASAHDPKERCREKYAQNIVVHVPIPVEDIACEPPRNASCPAQPWVLEP
jgi:hypothetical protein